MLAGDCIRPVLNPMRTKRPIATTFNSRSRSSWSSTGPLSGSRHEIHAATGTQQAGAAPGRSVAHGIRSMSPQAHSNGVVKPYSRVRHNSHLVNEDVFKAQHILAHPYSRGSKLLSLLSHAPSHCDQNAHKRFSDAPKSRDRLGQNIV